MNKEILDQWEKDAQEELPSQHLNAPHILRMALERARNRVLTLIQNLRTNYELDQHNQRLIEDLRKETEKLTSRINTPAEKFVKKEEDLYTNLMEEL